MNTLSFSGDGLITLQEQRALLSRQTFRIVAGQNEQAFSVVSVSQHSVGIFLVELVHQDNIPWYGILMIQDNPGQTIMVLQSEAPQDRNDWNRLIHQARLISQGNPNH